MDDQTIKDSPVTKLRLSNGLSVLLKEIHNAPIISHWLWYRVGSRNEIAGITGISHWVEHMLFKGTPQFPPAVLDKAISRDGGFWNAFTYLDWTTFFETMPADKIDLALRLESDRILNCLFDPDEVASERTVIISERQGNENEPLFRLGEELQAAAFRELRGLYTSRLGVQPGHRLVTGGPYQLVRHPGYLSNLLCLGGGMGLALSSLVGLGLTLFVVPLVVRRILTEEEMLAAEFGAEYERYRQQTPYRLLPLVF